MYNPANDAVAGYSSGTMTEKDPSQETTLGSAYSPVDYMSITSFPRLPEDDVVSGENTLKSRKDDDNFLSEQDTDPDLFLKSARLQRLPSSASDLASHDITPLRETTRDPLAEGCACQRDGLTVIITACLTFATGVTIALIMQIYFGDPQIFNQGAVVTDVAQCTSLGFEALEKQGSSVDAAIAAALCLGIIHPHTSGIGGGGVMLVHDIRRNESRVIDFSETAPSAILEDMLQTNLELKPGLMVGVPGMLSGMHQAHQLYGRMPWKDVVTMAADVARNGFNVTHDLAEALAKVKDKNVSEAFRALFLPNGQAPLSGLFSRRPDLAAILDTVAANGIAEFYSGNLTQEMAAAVQARGGVLSEEDFGNYTTVLQQPAESFYQGHHVMAAPAPSAGAALITALNILEGYNITSQVPRNSTYHWIAESLKIAVALASGLGDPMYDSSISDMVTQMLSKSQAVLLRQMINDSQAFPPGHYTPSYALEEGAVASQVMVMGPDDFIVSVMSSLNRPFGSRIVTPSGILLNSQILDFSWSNKTQTSQPPNPHNVIQPGKRPLSFLVPTAVRPRLGLCGTYVALGSSNGDRALSGITQVLMNVLSSRKNLSDSLAYGRLHPQLQPDTLLVDSEFLEEDVEVLQFKGHQVQRVDVLSLVEGTRRTNDLIIGVKDPRSADASALTMSMNMP
ncbi:glutathione hydrolase 7 [Salmo salar]|uniref:Glutathione hydrolase n=1 Tax=Salmo salar TaxID=8030 RepID=A0A1S3LGS5_SALSA|nr:glutathione hydrolase 7 [Salmo salar]XP_013990148.1 glutathione hydrolase 7 [Salmo salar]XP_013990150.1 glutathione hydrolase 7 [Salmo salar]XP_013990151.1 glutathione hydrolase 7 [Salmo salar]XP_045548966.1 glutathione hydrolase 7 [Salmo salar]XP_045548967.1 glutathione hydrolase 7 [Salmo salar]|eukprot:XP_013990147.1 PREDICTED: gamma-glutamyltransferase 7 [Salmo salar]